MKIEDVEERQKLAALYVQRNAVLAERDTALAPLEQQFHDAKRQAEREFVEAGGLTIADVLADRKLGTPSLADPKQMQLRIECDAKWQPQYELLADVRRGFEDRIAGVEREIDGIEEAIGAAAWESQLTDDGGPVFCAITGLLILDSDEIGIALAAAINERK